MTKRRRGGVAAWLSETDLPVFVLDERRVVLFFNRGCEQLTGWTAADVVGKTCDYAGAVDPEHVESLTGALCPPPQAFAGETVSSVVQLTPRTGEPQPRLVHYFPFQSAASEPWKVLGVIAGTPATNGSRGRNSEMDDLHARLSVLRGELRDRYRIDAVIAASAPMRRVLTQASLAIGSSEAVHLSGESGTGREFLARLIHYEGPRRLNAFVPLDCAASPVFELQRTLKRAFAPPDIDEASVPALQPGALFLRNVTALPRDLQERLVQSLDQQDKGRDPGVRLFSADSESLIHAVEEDRLLPELYYRLTPLVIDVPALRDRGDDLPLLGQHLLERINRDEDKQVGGVSQEVWERFRKYQWPGNVKELQAVVAECHASAQTPLVTAADLPFRFRTGYDAQQAGPPHRPQPINLEQFLESVERREIERVLRECGANKTRAAELLGLNRPRLYRRMEQLGISDPASTENPAGDDTAAKPNPARESTAPLDFETGGTETRSET